MNSKNRQEREREERREMILKAATKIISNEGIENLSVRKIAAQIEYSPSIIYHYFKDKEDIVANVFRTGYHKILMALQSVQITSTDPRQIIKDRMRAYINVSLEMFDEYRSVQLSTSPEILKYTSILFKGASKNSPAIGMLCQNLQQILGETDEDRIELTAQVILASTFGLIIRLINEQASLDSERKEQVIEHYIESIIEGVILSNTNLRI